jgi:hypothetical protein
MMISKEDIVPIMRTCPQDDFSRLPSCMLVPCNLELLPVLFGWPDGVFVRSVRIRQGIAEFLVSRMPRDEECLVQAVPVQAVYRTDESGLSRFVRFEV